MSGNFDACGSGGGFGELDGPTICLLHSSDGTIWLAEGIDSIAAATSGFSPSPSLSTCTSCSSCFELHQVSQ